jgi:uncharacterized pyridoxal phosphate-containing UPF0001 family protein
MGIGSLTDQEELTRQEFSFLRQCFDDLKSEYFEDRHYFKEVSMGMSNDYQLAINQGASIVRIGSLIFGARN